MCIESYDPSVLNQANTTLESILWSGFGILLVSTIIASVKKNKYKRVLLITTIVLLVVTLISAAKPDLFIHACG